MTKLQTQRHEQITKDKKAGGSGVRWWGYKAIKLEINGSYVTPEFAMSFYDESTAFEHVIAHEDDRKGPRAETFKELAKRYPHWQFFFVWPDESKTATDGWGTYEI